MDPTQADREPQAGAQRRFFRRNYLAHVLEGGLFMGGLSFVAAETVFPKMIHSLGGPVWLIALAPSLMSIGFFIPPIFNAHWIERLQRVRPAVLLFGVFQRLPYLIAGLALLLLGGGDHARLALALAALAPLISGLAGGIALGAWFELVGRVIPAPRLASSWALRQILMGCIGLGAGALIKPVLDSYPGACGYGILHLIAFGFLALSFGSLSCIREIAPDRPPEPARRGLLDNLLSVPTILRADRSYGDFLLSRALSGGILILTPFLSIHALAVTGLGDGHLGYLVSAQMLGALVGNAIAGYLGDRFGNRLPMLAARLLFVAVAAGFAFNRAQLGFLVLFFLFGAAYYMNQVGENAFPLELAPVGRRPTYLAVLFLVTCVSMLGAAGVATLVASRGGLLTAAPIAGALLLGSFLALLRVPDPRRRLQNLA